MLRSVVGSLEEPKKLIENCHEQKAEMCTSVRKAYMPITLAGAILFSSLKYHSTADMLRSLVGRSCDFRTYNIIAITWCFHVKKKNLIQGTSMHQQKVEIACVSIWISVIGFITNNSEHRRTTGEVKKADLRPSWTPLEGHGECLRHGNFFFMPGRWNPVCCSS